MKLDSLSIIFIIILLPITIVLSAYIDNKITCRELELEYDSRLITATYDAVKAYQLNTVSNQFGDVTNEKVSDMESSVNIFLSSLTTSFGYSGYKSSVMEEYVPAIVFTTYDGYYIYSPYNNTLTNVSDYDSDYSKDGEETTGLKPYVTYSCRYVDDSSNSDFIISYTLDNYITIEGIIKGTYYYDYGYLYNVDSGDYAIKKQNDTTYTYDGIAFIESTTTEEMREYVGETEYSYVKINGTKYYLELGYYGDNGNTTNYTDVETVFGTEKIDLNAGIFYIDSSGEKNYSQAKYNSSDPTGDASTRFIKYYTAIKYNKSAYEYYKNAYEFSKAVLGSAVSGYTDKAGTPLNNSYSEVLKNLTWENASIWDTSADDTTSLQEYAGSSGGETCIFDTSDSAIQLSTSNFNEHRKAIIRYTIETNLVSSIASFSNSKGSSFVMPKISEDDWDIIENNVCAISFLQGMSIGTKTYNGYAVVANTLTNEYIDENDIYILAYDSSSGNYIYCKANDGTISGKGTSSVSILSKGASLGTTSVNHYAGIWKLNFETKQDVSTGETLYYIPMSYKNGSKLTSYYGSYTSIFGSYNINPISTGGTGTKVTWNGTNAEYSSTDMYTYIHATGNYTLKEAYYYGLGRERWGSFNVNNINYELYENTRTDSYFLKDY